jgi:hypothetical protein
MAENAEKTAPKKRGRKPVLDPELVAAALADLQGNVAGAAKRFGVARQSVADLIERRPALQQVLQDAREGMLDNAESSLYRAVLAGEAWAVCFFLKTQGRTRGYVEKAPESPPPDERDKPSGVSVDVLTRLFAALGTRLPDPRAGGSLPGGTGAALAVGAEPGAATGSVPQ